MNGQTNNKKEVLIHMLYVNDKNSKIYIYANLVDKKLILVGKRRLKTKQGLEFFELSRKEVDLHSNMPKSFEKLCKEVYDEMEESEFFFPALNAFFHETTQIEIEEEGKKKKKPKEDSNIEGYLL
jgi:hypothetical protein